MWTQEALRWMQEALRWMQEAMGTDVSTRATPPTTAGGRAPKRGGRAVQCSAAQYSVVRHSAVQSTARVCVPCGLVAGPGSVVARGQARVVLASVVLAPAPAPHPPISPSVRIPRLPLRHPRPTPARPRRLDALDSVGASRPGAGGGE
eukprot:2359432-Pyramimonas_sp.AAC.1